MPNDPRVGLGVGMLTALVAGDKEGFFAIANEFGDDCPEALAVFGRVVQAMVKMVAQESNVTPDEVVQAVALAIEAGNYE